MVRSLLWMILVVAVALVGGCARYEYSVQSPREFSGSVGTKEDYTFRREPLDYRLRTVSNRLVMRIYNPTDTPIGLLGSESTVVSPDGQSHPLPTLTIAPQSYIKLHFPPQPPRIYRGGTTFGVGVGAIYGRGTSGRAPYAASGGRYPIAPRYLRVYDDGTIYWEWRGEGEIRLTLVYERNQDIFSHDFAIVRHRK